MLIMPRHVTTQSSSSWTRARHSMSASSSAGRHKGSCRVDICGHRRRAAHRTTRPSPHHAAIHPTRRTVCRAGGNARPPGASIFAAPQRFIGAFGAEADHPSSASNQPPAVTLVASCVTHFNGGHPTFCPPSSPWLWLRSDVPLNKRRKIEARLRGEMESKRRRVRIPGISEMLRPGDL